MYKLHAEYRHFLSFPRDMRVLLLANMAYAFVMPIVNTFGAAYVMRESDNVAVVVGYQWIVYACIPPMFLLTGFLLRRIAIKRLYSISMLLTGLAMTVLMTRGRLTLANLTLAGVLTGTAVGIHWASRGFLGLSATTDANRNYYSAVENAFLTVTSVLVPLAAGWLIDRAAAGRLLSGRPEHAYTAIAVGVFLFATAAAAIIQGGQFSNPPLSRFVYFRFPPLWNRFIVLAALKGLVQGYLVTAPAMLIMRVAHRSEGALGLAQSTGSIVAALALYAIGRVSTARHRIRILAGGLVLFVLGSLCNAVLFNPSGVWLFMLCMLVSGPLLELGYFPIEMLVIDMLASLQQRNRYSYILNHEFGLLAGRTAGCGLFVVLAICVSQEFALRYALLSVGLLQLFSIGVAKAVWRDCEDHRQSSSSR